MSSSASEVPPLFGALLPQMVVPPPGPASAALRARLARVESRNVTYLGRDDGDDAPVFWTQARGANVLDADGNRYLDLTGAFGVAVAGHAHPRIVAAMKAQADLLVHGMGDVHPPEPKVRLLEALAARAPWDETRGFLANSGAEAVEAALKTALLATGRPGILAFEGGYHGLTLGALAATARADFRHPFRERIHAGCHFAPYPDALEAAGRGGGVGGGGGVVGAGRDVTAERGGEGIAGVGRGATAERGGEGVVGAGRGATAAEALEAVDAAFRAAEAEGVPIGAVIIEPLQGRGGVRVPEPGFLAALVARAHGYGAVVIFDEIYSGWGRTGRCFAFEWEGVAPDLLCVGKALGGGLPLSACLGDAAIMDAWPTSTGEALHTSTFLGHPLACTTALAFLEVLEDERLVARAEVAGARLRAGLEAELGPDVKIRGRGLFLGVVLDQPGAGVRVSEAALREGVILLPAGNQGEVVELSPPLTLTDAQLDCAVQVVSAAIRGVVARAG